MEPSTPEECYEAIPVLPRINKMKKKVEVKFNSNKQQFESINDHLKQISKLLKSVLNNKDPHQINLPETQQVCKELSSTFSHAAGLIWMAVEFDSTGILLAKPLLVPPPLEVREAAEALLRGPTTTAEKHLLPAILPPLPLSLVEANDQRKRCFEEAEIVEIPVKRKRGRPFAVDENGNRIHAGPKEKSKAVKPKFEGVERFRDTEEVKAGIELLYENLKFLLAERNGLPITSMEAFIKLKERNVMDASSSVISVGRILGARSHTFLSDKKSTPTFTLLSHSESSFSPRHVSKALSVSSISSLSSSSSDPTDF